MSERVKATLIINGEIITREVDREVLSSKMKSNQEAAKSLNKKPGNPIDARLTDFSFDKYSVIEAINESLPKEV